MLADLAPMCPVCGAQMLNAELHQRFHDGLRELARMVEAPDSTPAEYEQAIREAAEREAASREGN